MSIYNQSQTSPYLGAQAKTVPAVAPKNTLKPADTKKGFIGGTLNPDGTMGTGKVSGVEPFNIISKKTTPVQPATGANVLGNTDIPGMTGTASMKPVPKEKTSIISATSPVITPEKTGGGGYTPTIVTPPMETKPTLTPYQKYVADNNARGLSSATEAVFNGQGLPGSTQTQNIGGQITHIDLNGNTVDTTGKILSGPDYKADTTNDTTTRAGILAELIKQSQTPNASYQTLQDQLSANAAEQAKLKSDYAEANKNVQTSGIGSIMATGQGNIMQNTLATKQGALASQAGALSTQLGAAQAQQNIGLTGLQNAQNAYAPITPGYNQQVLNPITGQPVNQTGGSGTGAMSILPPQGQQMVQSLAQQVNEGKMTRADAESRLSAYGQPGIEALNQALGEGFNTNASNASAGTTAQGQQLSAAIPPANQALDMLQTAFNSLGPITGSNIPLLQQFAQNIAMQTGIGRTNVSNFQGALQEARSRIDAALAGVIGVNAASTQAHALLPDNMTAQELPGKIAAAKEYLQNQLKSYQSSGSQTGSSTGGGTTVQTTVGTINTNW